ALALAAAGCGKEAPAPVVHGPEEAPDAGPPDAGPPDAGPPDAGPIQPPDAGPTGPEGPVCTAPTAGWAEAGGAQWGCPDSDELLDVVVDAQGRLLLAGYERGALTQNITPSGDARAVLWTLPAQGAPTVQALDLPGTPEVLEALALHPQTGAPYFTGRTPGAFPGFGAQGQQDLFVGEVAQDGALHVRYQGGDAYPQHPNRLAFDSAGDLLVAGYDDTWVVGSAVQRWEDPFVLKLRLGEPGAPLSELWWQRFETAGPDLLLALGAGPADGAFYVGGLDSEGMQRGPYVQRRDAQGALVWERRFSDLGADAVGAVQALADGSVLVAGTTFGTLGEHSHGQQDAVVQRLDGATGEVLWTAQLGSAQSDWVTDLAVDPVDGSIAVVGETLGTVDPAHPHAGEYDVFLARLDAQGRVLGLRQWGSAGDERPAAVALDAQGRALLVGYTTGALAGPLQGGRDAFLLVTAPTR
ncbi:MAG TPA: hypothetical protein VFO83_10470, partial [Aggregicoccus sp.]|nr:hypothetical protein [Aggregicoccus sp.]